MRAMSALPQLTPPQLWTLLALTLVWGLNWPIMKLEVSGFPAWGSRAWGGAAAATVGGCLLLWHELMQFSGQPVVVLMMLFLALWLGEVLYWQDWTAVALIALAIGTVLWPARPAH